MHGRPEWSDGKNARSRRTIPIDPSTAKVLAAHRTLQAEERLVAGSSWIDNDLVVATKTGHAVSPGNFDQTLERLVERAGVPRLTSHGLRHTAATHMVRHAADIGEIRAAADLLGHSPDMLMRTYAHALPESISAVTEKIGEPRQPAPRLTTRRSPSRRPSIDPPRQAGSPGGASETSVAATRSPGRQGFPLAASGRP